MTPTVIASINITLAVACLATLGMRWHRVAAERDTRPLVIPMAVSLLFIVMSVVDLADLVDEPQQRSGWHLFDLFSVGGYLALSFTLTKTRRT